MENILLIFIESYHFLDKECDHALGLIENIETAISENIPNQLVVNIKAGDTKNIKTIQIKPEFKYPFLAKNYSLKSNTEFKKIVSRVHDKDSLYRKIKAYNLDQIGNT